MVLHIFAHNFLNIQRIFNPQNVLESWDLGLSNHANWDPCMHFWHLWHTKHYSPYSTYWATFDTFDMRNITLYWGPCIHIWHLQHTKHYSPYSTHWATFDTFDMSNITLYQGPCMHFRCLWHSLWSFIGITVVFHTFDTSDMPFDLLLIVQYLVPLTPLTSKSHSIYNVDSNSKYSN